MKLCLPSTLEKDPAGSCILNRRGLEWAKSYLLSVRGSVARVLGSEHNGVIIVARSCLDVCFHSNKKTREKQLFAEENYEALCETD